MGNAVGSLFSGFGQLLDTILGHPLNFLSGKACESACRPTWDLMCYIENFCVSHLLKLALVAILVYFVLLFLYLVYKLGICQCTCHIICRTFMGCCTTYFSALNCCCSFLCFKLRNVKQSRPRRRDPEECFTESEEENERSSFGRNARRSRRRDYRKRHIRKSLRPMGHRVGVELSGNLKRKKLDSCIDENRTSPLQHHIRVTRSSRFSVKGSRRKKRNYDPR